MLDDLQFVSQKDPSDALGVAANVPMQIEAEVNVENADNDARQINNIVVAGMGGSALAALVVKSWLSSRLNVPFEVSRTYDLPSYVSSNTLFIASSYSGNTEETLSCLDQATNVDAQVAVIAAGGKLLEIASQKNMSFVKLPANMQPRMAVNYNLKALVALLINFGLLQRNVLDELTSEYSWLETESKKWLPATPTSENYAKQLAMLIAGKTPIFYGGSITAPVAYKFKISMNENGKNVAVWNEYPEVSHNEFLGWSSHPVEKPFAIFDIVSSFEHPQILRRFELTDKLLSGKRPKTNRIELKGNSLLAQLLWGGLLADFVGIYLGILNGVDPTQVDLIDKLKKELK